MDFIMINRDRFNKILTQFKKDFVGKHWEDEKYKVNHHKLALDIKRSAEQNIILYQKQVTSESARL